MSKFWVFALIFIGTLIGGVTLIGISTFAGLHITYRMACGVSLIGTYFSTINSKKDIENLDILDSFLNFLTSCGIISVVTLLMHFGFKLFGA